MTTPQKFQMLAPTLEARFDHIKPPLLELLQAPDQAALLQSQEQAPALAALQSEPATVKISSLQCSALQPLEGAV
ncbi:hypothetical protein [Stenomitos frigidus]|uniref:Uncharacterized protein n=1 Tax=Stenomitos frigidus ULC18 TaxID=2107698 RepID=A0A2T1EMG4_9CYAN|nr:hypothetical protein [Stenomitos frigidus]PSB33932.1 hypothetical protein C7B82_03455 [Stenomitos frigidus ULC18]